jgi:glucosamine 6-phosphate synthetase-like amidotransferase/phosphosugar isomerase protein
VGINNIINLDSLLLRCPGSAVIEHTNRVIFLEDDDVAAVTSGRLTIHRIKRTAGDHPARANQTLQMELQQIMKGEGEGKGWGYSTVMGQPSVKMLMVLLGL